jgi:hypothetical protein
VSRAFAASGLLLVLCLVPVVASAANIPSGLDGINIGMTEDLGNTGMVPKAIETSLKLPSGKEIPRVMKSMGTSYSGKVAVKIWDTGTTYHWEPNQTAVWGQHANMGEYTASLVGPIPGSDDGMVICASWTHSSSDGGSVRAFDPQTYGVTETGWGGSTPWPVFPRGSAEVYQAGLSDEYGRVWKGDWPEYKGAGDTTLPAMPKMGAFTPGAPHAVQNSGVMYLFASIPSTGYPGLYECREVFIYKDCTRRAIKTNSWTQTYPDWTGGQDAGGIDVTFNPNDWNGSPVWAKADGGYPYAGLNDITWRGLSMQGSDGFVYGCTMSLSPYDIADVYREIPLYNPLSGDESMTVIPRKPETQDSSELTIYLNEKLAPLTGGVGSLLWPLRLFNDFVGE